MKDSIIVKLSTLSFLCDRTQMPVSEELDQLAVILGKPLDISKSKFSHIAYTGETQKFCAFSKLTQKDLDRINRRTYKVKVGKCVLDKIKELLSELRSEAPRGTKRQVNELAKAIIAKATTEATRKPRPDGSTVPTEQTPKNAEQTPKNAEQAPKNAETNPPEETNVEKAEDDAGYEILPNGNVCLKEDLSTDDAGYEILPNGNVCLKDDLSSDDSNAKSGEEEEEEPYADVIGREALEKAIEISATTGLPVVYLKTVDEKHVKKMIYCHCTIKIGGKRKISKRALFIDCKFSNKPATAKKNDEPAKKSKKTEK